MTTVSMAEAKAHLEKISDEVFRTNDRVHVTRDGREFVVIISAADLESLEATIELLSDPVAMAEIEIARQQVALGEFTSLDDMRDLMVQRRLGGR